eukprot:12742932-Ditylum_brightwellii.AAC.1
MNIDAALPYYDFHTPLAIRYAGSNYSASYRDVDWVLNTIQSAALHETFTEAERVFKVGSPNKPVVTLSRENFLTYWRY